MKARIQKKESILLYGISPVSQEGEAIQVSMERLGIPVCFLAPKAREFSLKTCIADPSLWATGDVTFPAGDEPLFFMNGLSNSRRDQALERFRQDALPSIPLKAMVTPHNLDWTIQKLARELAREHQMMGEYQKLRRGLAVLSQKLEEAPDPAGERLKETAQALLARVSQVSYQELAEMNQALEQYGVK